MPNNQPEIEPSLSLSQTHDENTSDQAPSSQLKPTSPKGSSPGEVRQERADDARPSASIEVNEMNLGQTVDIPAENRPATVPVKSTLQRYSTEITSSSPKVRVGKRIQSKRNPDDVFGDDEEGDVGTASRLQGIKRRIPTFKERPHGGRSFHLRPPRGGTSETSDSEPNGHIIDPPKQVEPKNEPVRFICLNSSDLLSLI